MSGDGLWVLAADGAAVLAQAHPRSEFSAACFTGPDSVVALDSSDGYLGRYRIMGNHLELQAWLELRFEADVGLADTRPAGGADDVSLGA